MIRLLSLPLIISSSISLILGFIFALLYFRLKARHEEPVHYYWVFSLSAVVSGVFLGAFAVLVNSGENLDYLDISNRIAIITCMFTIVLGLHFYVTFFDYKPPVFLKWCYAVCVLFSFVTLVPNPYFLEKEFYPTSTYYTGLAFGPIFQLWGVWILVLAAYCITTLVRVYLRTFNDDNSPPYRTVQLLLIANVVWMITGVGDTLTSIQLLDLPPLTWIGSFFVTCTIAWTLVLQIDDLHKERNELSYRLMYDHLTQAFSRSYFEVQLSAAIKEVSETSAPLYVCMFDVDDFKSVNDKHGHASGDELLKGIVEITKDNIRSIDCVARLGGDEFILLLSGLESDEHALQVVERIRSQIDATMFGTQGDQFHASCSFGITGVSKQHLALKDLSDRLLSYADQALYTSKHNGKNKIVISCLPLEPLL